VLLVFLCFDNLKFCLALFFSPGSVPLSSVCVQSKKAGCFDFFIFFFVLVVECCDCVYFQISSSQHQQSRPTVVSPQGLKRLIILTSMLSTPSCHNELKKATSNWSAVERGPASKGKTQRKAVIGVPPPLRMSRVHRRISRRDQAGVSWRQG